MDASFNDYSFTANDDESRRSPLPQPNLQYKNGRGINILDFDDNIDEDLYFDKYLEEDVDIEQHSPISSFRG